MVIKTVLVQTSIARNRSSEGGYLNKFHLHEIIKKVRFTESKAKTSEFRDKLVELAHQNHRISLRKYQKSSLGQEHDLMLV